MMTNPYIPTARITAQKWMKKGKMRMFDFAEKTSNMSAVEILNYYRNLYYAEPQVTERGIMANAINDVLGIINSQKEEIEQWQEEANNWQTIACQQSVDVLSFSELIENAYKQGANAFAAVVKKELAAFVPNVTEMQAVVDNSAKKMIGERGEANE